MPSSVDMASDSSSKEGLEAKQLCIKAFDTWPINNTDGPPTCITSDRLDSEVGGVFRNPSTDLEEIYDQGH